MAASLRAACGGRSAGTLNPVCRPDPTMSHGLASIFLRAPERSGCAGASLQEESGPSPTRMKTSLLLPLCALGLLAPVASAHLDACHGNEPDCLSSCMLHHEGGEGHHACNGIPVVAGTRECTGAGGTVYYVLFWELHVCEGP